MSNNGNENNIQYSVLCEQGDLGLWDTPLKAEDNKKVIDQAKAEAEKKDWIRSLWEYGGLSQSFRNNMVIYFGMYLVRRKYFG